MTDKNIHIKEYLDYYLGMKTSPEFEIFLQGEWGSGKTWFLKKYLREAQTKHLYISLNGISSYAEIEDLFFQQLHPVLASKGMKLATKILKGIVKTAVKIDLNGDHKPDATVSSSIPDLNLPDYFKDADDKLLVFDDLERCSINIPSILGYINQFVESNGMKVIIVANEDEIIKADQKNEGKFTAYLNIKEKLIGRTFKIYSYAETALKDFTEQIGDLKIKNALQQNELVILEIYRAALYNNLRHLKQTVLDFERFYPLLPQVAMQKKELLEHILRLFFAISFELRKGDLIESDLTLLLDPFSPAEKQSPIALAKLKYEIFHGYVHPVKSEDWICFFKTGMADKESIQESVLKSDYFEHSNMPDWEKLWRYYQLEDTEFNALQSKVFKAFGEILFDDKYVIIQITGILLRNVECRLLDCSVSDVIEIGKKNLEFCKSLGGKKFLNPFEDYPSSSSHGLQYQSLQMQEFVDFLSFAKELSHSNRIESTQHDAEKLLQIMKRSIMEFKVLMILSHGGDSSYFNIAILHHIPVQDFIDEYFSLSIKDKIELSHVLEKRYQFAEYNITLIEELDWINRIIEWGQATSQAGTRSLSRYIFEENFIAMVKKSAAKLLTAKESVSAV